MKIFKLEQVDEIAKELLDNKVGILPTDTIYGIHCLALNKSLIDRVYTIKERPAELPVIRLISKPEDLSSFNISPTEFEQQQIQTYWPGPNTLIFINSFGESLSFRQPNNAFLIKLLSMVGPLISTSANVHKVAPALDVQSAINMFGEKIDFYVDGGVLNNPPSSVYKLVDNQVFKLR